MRLLRSRRHRPASAPERSLQEVERAWAAQLHRWAGIAEAQAAADPAFEQPTWRVVWFDLPRRPSADEVAQAEAEAARWQEAEAQGRVYERSSVRYWTFVAERVRAEHLHPVIPPSPEAQMDALAAEGIYPSRELIAEMRRHGVAEDLIAHATRLAETLPARVERAARRADYPLIDAAHVEAVHAVRAGTCAPEDMAALCAVLEPLADARCAERARDASLDAAAL